MYNCGFTHLLQLCGTVVVVPPGTVGSHIGVPGLEFHSAANPSFLVMHTLERQPVTSRVVGFLLPVWEMRSSTTLAVAGFWRVSQQMALSASVLLREEYMVAGHGAWRRELVQ